MKHSLKNLIGYSIETNDGMEGKIKDFLFDEDNWAVRYLEADFGGFFNDKRVILPVDVIINPNWENNQILLNTSKEKIGLSPAPAEIPTISREYEQKLYEHYGYPMYWGAGYVPPLPSGAYFPARPLNVPKNKQISEKAMNSSLRSFKDVEGYNIRATDDTLGHVEDLIVDDADWQLVYLIVDTSNWLPWSKKVMLAVDWMKEISYANREVKINLTTDTIKDAPDYDSDQPIEMSYEHELSEYYQRNRLM
ncbi:MAG: PRC-barrel domain-containing protein [Bacteroidales bacterium]|nr:PRC-barrel domain-containing protein [Bacteroidales bacterium]